jgi:hypothetical protein
MVLTFLALHAHAQPTPMPARFAYEEATIDALQMGIAGGPPHLRGPCQAPVDDQVAGGQT